MGIYRLDRGLRMTQRPDRFSLNVSSPFYNGLVFAGLGQFPFTTRYHDSSPYANVGTLTNMEPMSDWVWVPELGRWALDFDGSNDYAALATAAVNSIIGLPYTMACWLKTTTTSTSGVMFAGKLADPYYIAEIEITNTSTVRLGGNAAGTAWTNDYATAGFAAWTHIAHVHTGAAVLCYVNGVAQGSPLAKALPSTISGFDFALAAKYAGTSALLAGKISDPMLFARALSPSEICAQADPSNVMLSGLILPPRRRVFASAAMGAGGTTYQGDFTEGAKSSDSLVGSSDRYCALLDGGKSSDDIQSNATLASQVQEGSTSADVEQAALKAEVSLHNGVKSADSLQRGITTQRSLSDQVRSGGTYRKFLHLHTAIIEGKKAGDFVSRILSTKLAVANGAVSSDELIGTGPNIVDSLTVVQRNMRYNRAPSTLVCPNVHNPRMHL